MTRWMSEEYAPECAVTAIDVDPRNLVADLPPAVRVQTLDLSQQSMGSGLYDLVHCRFLLVHLPDHLQVLRRMVASLRSGGALVVVESDYDSWEVPDGYPELQRVRDAYVELARHNGWNLSLGSEVATMMELAGLQEVAAEGHVVLSRGGGTTCDLVARSIVALRPDLLAAGVADTDVSAAATALASPQLAMRYVTTWATWGYRPA